MAMLAILAACHGYFACGNKVLFCFCSVLPQYGHWPRNCQTRGGVRCKPIRQVAPLDAASNTVYNSRSHICNRLLVSISRSVASCSLCTEKNSSKSLRDALRYPANAWWSVCLSTLKCRTKHWPIDVIDVSIRAFGRFVNDWKRPLTKRRKFCYTVIL